MSLPGGEVVAAREAVLRRSLALLLARDQAAEKPALYFACRHLVRVIDANLARQPAGWRDDDHGTVEVVPGRDAVLRHCLALLLAERNLSLSDDSVPALLRAEKALYFACRQLVRAIDTHHAWQPAGWRDEDREASRS